MIYILFEIRRWSDLETQQNKANRHNPLALSYSFEKKGKDLASMLSSKPGGLDAKEMKGLKHSNVFMNNAIKQTIKARKEITPSRKKYPPYIGPERRKANLPRIKKAA